MTPAARVQAAIEILDLVIAAARENGAPADRIVSDWFRARRFAGSGDRRAIRELAYRAIRTCGDIPKSGRAAMLLLAAGDPALPGLFDGSAHGPAHINPNEKPATAGIAPPWLEKALAESGISGTEAAALLDRAPLDVRVNTLREALLDLPMPGEPTAAPHGLRFPSDSQVEKWDAYANGVIEVQDTGSQLVCEAVGAQPGETIIDLCAGAGGKTLQLAAAMNDSGRLIASDTDRGRLSRLPQRAARAGASCIETVLLNPGKEAEALSEWQPSEWNGAGKADAVLIDAPCSGTGTWRRNPEARWRLTQAGLDRLVGTQERLLDLAATLVRPGGRLVYVTCSLLDVEGAAQAVGFLSRHGGWRAEMPPLPAGRSHGPGLRLTPAHDGTDGFFVARFTRL